MLDQRTRSHREQSDHRSPPAQPSGGSGVAELAERARSGNPLNAIALFVAGAAVAVATAMLIVQNTEPATIEWWAWDPTGPMWIVLLLTFVAGLLMGPVLAGAYVLARTRRSHRDERIDELARSAGRR
jgi:uncharacterized integral membrane protein